MKIYVPICNERIWVGIGDWGVTYYRTRNHIRRGRTFNLPVMEKVLRWFRLWGCHADEEGCQLVTPVFSIWIGDRARVFHTRDRQTGVKISWGWPPRMGGCFQHTYENIRESIPEERLWNT